MATAIAFHAHPDDEVLLTGGTLARLAAEGHRVILAGGHRRDHGAGGRPGRAGGLDELRAST